MRLSFLFASMSLFSAHAIAGESSYYLDLVNASPDSLESFAIASAGSGDYVVASFADQALRGGGSTATLRIRSVAADCLRDIRLTFVTGYTLVQRDFNVCHRQRLTIKRSKGEDVQPTSLLSGR